MHFGFFSKRAGRITRIQSKAIGFPRSIEQHGRRARIITSLMKNLLEKVFASINSAGIEYVIVRNYESLPDAIIDGDIDLLVSREDAERLRSILREMGFLIIPDLFPHTFALFFDETNGELIKFDIMDSLAFGQKMIMPFPGDYEKRVLDKRVLHGEFYIPSAEDEIILLLLHCVKDKGFFEPAYKEKLRKLAGCELDTEYVDGFFVNVFGQKLSENILPWIRRGKFERLAGLQTRVSMFLFKSLTMKSLLMSLTIVNQRVARKLLGRRGLRIALMGPDGSGKTTLARTIRDRRIFNTVCVYMGRDQFIIPTRRIFKYMLDRIKKKKGTNGTATAESRSEGLIQAKGIWRDGVDVVRFFHDLIDFYLRYFLYNYLHCRKGFLVINDRYIYDMLLGGEKVQRLWFFRWIIISLFPAPDFVFLLDAPAEKMHARKGEHSTAFLNAMKKKYAALSKIIEKCFVIRTSENAEESAHEIIAHIWKDYYRNLAQC